MNELIDNELIEVLKPGCKRERWVTLKPDEYYDHRFKGIPSESLIKIKKTIEVKVVEELRFITKKHLEWVIVQYRLETARQPMSPPKPLSRWMKLKRFLGQLFRRSKLPKAQALKE